MEAISLTLLDRPRRKAATPWYLAGGINIVNCIAAYQPKNATSLINSYVNLADPGTYNAAPGVAPAFATASGWTFADSSNQHLVTGVIPDRDTGTLIIQYSGAGIAGGPTYVGVSAGSKFTIGNYGDTMDAARGNNNVRNAPALTAGNYAISGNTAYRNGVAEPLTITLAGAAITSDFYIGGLNTNGAYTDYTTGPLVVQALAYYDIDLNPAQIAALVAAMQGVVSGSAVPQQSAPKQYIDWIISP